MNVFLLAAGEGTRLRPHTLVLPKPAIPFLTVPLAAYSLAFLRGLKIDKLVVNTFHLPEKIHTTFQNLPHGAKELLFSDEVGEILGSGGGLKKAEALLRGQGDFLLMNADEVLLPEKDDFPQQALVQHQTTKPIATLMVTEHPEVGSKFGGVWTKGHEILGFGKQAPPGAEKGWHFVGTQVLSERIFDYLPETGAANILYDGVTRALAAGEKAMILPVNGDWFETGNEADFLAASRICVESLFSDGRQGRYLKEVLRIFGKAPLHLESGKKHHALFAAHSQISLEAELEGFIIGGIGSKVPSGCHLKNVCLGDHVSLPENTHMENRLILQS